MLSALLLLAVAAAPPPTRFDISVGWTAIGSYDPFTPAAGTFTAGAPGVDSRLDTGLWAFRAAADVMDRSLRMRQLNFEVRRRVLRFNGVQLGLAAQYADVALRHESGPGNADAPVTRREARLYWGGVDVSRHFSWAEASVLCAAGSYRGRFYRTPDDEPFTGAGLVGVDALPITGAELSARDIVIADRVRMSVSARYLRILGGHSPWVPDSDMSGSLSLGVRAGTVCGKPFFIGGLVRLGPQGPALMTNRAFGLHGTLRFK